MEFLKTRYLILPIIFIVHLSPIFTRHLQYFFEFKQYQCTFLSHN